MLATPTHRPFAACEEDLHWFFNDSPGELGLHSNFPPMVLRLILGGDSPRTVASYEIDDCQLDAARRARRIERALSLVTEDRRDTLVGTFSGEAPLPMRLAFRELAWLAARSTAATEAYRNSNTARTFEDWLSRLPRRAKDDLVARLTLDRVILEAGQVLVQALLEFRAARAEVRRG